MWQTFIAVVWMQARSVVNGFQRLTQRDTFSQLATGFALLVTIGTSLGFGMVVLVASYLSSTRGDITQVSLWVLGATFLFTIVQGVSGERGLSLDLRKFLVLPISRSGLAVIELLASFLAPMQWVFFPVLGALVLGISAGAGFWAGATTFVVGTVTLLVAVTLQRALVNGATLAGRRARELLGVGLVAFWVGATFLFTDASMTTGGLSVRRFLVGTPGELGTRVILAVSGHPDDSVWLPVAGLGVWLLVSFVVHLLVMRALVARGGAEPTMGRVRHRRTAFAGLLERLLPPEWLGVLAAEVRTLTRMPFAWMLLMIPAMLGVFLGGVGAEDQVQLSGVDYSLSELIMMGFLVAGPSMLSSMILLNMFGTDAEGVGHYILFPSRGEWVFAGKGTARCLYVVAQLLLCSVGFMIRGMTNPEVLLTGLAGGTVVAVWLVAAGNLTSTRLAYRLSSAPGRQAGGSAAVRSMLGQMMASVEGGLVGAVVVVSLILGGFWLGIAAAAVLLVAGVVVFVLTARLGADWLVSYGPDLLQELSREP